MALSNALEPSRNFLAHDAAVNQVVVSPLDGTLATADVNMQVRVWRGGSLLREYDSRSFLDKVRPTERVRGLAFGNHSDVLFMAAGQNVTAVSLSGGDEPRWSHVPPFIFGFLITSPTGVVARDGIVAACFDSGTMTFFDEDGTILSSIRHNSAPRMFEAVSEQRIIGCDGFNITLWSKESKKPLRSLQLRDRVYGFASSASGHIIAVRHLFETRILAFESGAELASYEQGRGLPLLRLSPDNEFLAIGTQHTIDLYEVGGSRRSTRISLQEAELISLTFGANGHEVIAGCSDGKVRFWQNSLIH